MRSACIRAFALCSIACLLASAAACAACERASLICSALSRSAFFLALCRKLFEMRCRFLDLLCILELSLVELLACSLLDLSQRLLQRIRHLLFDLIFKSLQIRIDFNFYLPFNAIRFFLFFFKFNLYFSAFRSLVLMYFFTCIIRNTFKFKLYFNALR